MKTEENKKPISNYKAGFVGLIGLPNAGKSSLLNEMVKEKVSIVNPKPQTTRRRVLGIVNQKEGQIVLVDAPGVLSEKGELNSFLFHEAQDVIDQSDVLIAVLNPDEKKKESLLKIINLVKESGKPWIPLITKMDQSQFVNRIKILKDILLEEQKKSTTMVMPIFQISTQWKKDEIQDVSDSLIKTLLGLLPSSPGPLYDIELFTPHTLRDMAAEIVREKCFEELHHEVPYQIAIRIQKFDETQSHLTKIYADILVAKETQKSIVVGKGGATIKQIGTKARKELEALLGQKVFLSLEVVFRKDWFENKDIMKELGYSVDDVKK